MQFFDPHSAFFFELGTKPRPENAASARARDRVRSELAGASVNASEARRVGHAWLRAPQLAPTPEIRQAIEGAWAEILRLEVKPGQRVLLLGIGGSALGVQCVGHALARDPSALMVMDNADPQGIAASLARVDPRVTTPVVVTKSGTSAETLSLCQAAMAHWRRHGHAWEQDAIAITGPGSPLETNARSWRAVFPIWPFVGGRFCVTSPAGLLPLHLVGVDISALLRGAAAVDTWTGPDVQSNPALLCAHAWYHGQAEQGLHSIALLAYRDRLRYLGRYVQQLLMESLGKAEDLDANPVQQGLSVFGERGSCDQHSILQYLTQGRNDTFTMLIETRQDALDEDTQRLADQHLARCLGTYQSLGAARRPRALLSVPGLDADSLGAVIAFFERCVGYYAGMANLNAYDQPGVEHGKQASAALADASDRIVSRLGSEWICVADLAQQCGLELSVTWRLAMQCVSQQHAEHRVAPEVALHAFRLRT